MGAIQGRNHLFCWPGGMMPSSGRCLSSADLWHCLWFQAELWNLTHLAAAPASAPAASAALPQGPLLPAGAAASVCNLLVESGRRCWVALPLGTVPSRACLWRALCPTCLASRMDRWSPCSSLCRSLRTGAGTHWRKGTWAVCVVEVCAMQPSQGTYSECCSARHYFFVQDRCAQRSWQWHAEVCPAGERGSACMHPTTVSRQTEQHVCCMIPLFCTGREFFQNIMTYHTMQSCICYLRQPVV